MKRAFSFVVLMLLLASMLTLAFNIQPARAETEQTPTGWYWPAGTGDTSGHLGYLAWSPKRNGWHLAQDFPLDQGLPVYAIADGEVALSRTDIGGYGRDGTPGGALAARFKTSAGEFLVALYGHIDNPHAVGKVEAGLILGYTNDINHLHFGIHPGYELPENPWRGYTYDENETYGWVDPVQFLLSNHPPARTYNLNVGGQAFTLTARTNSTLGNIDTSDVTTSKNMSFTVQGSRRTGMCNITLPNSMLGGPYTLTVGGKPPWSSSTTIVNGTHTALYFTYNGTGKYTVQIIGATAIPEFTVPITILLCGILTLTMVSLKKRRIFP